MSTWISPYEEGTSEYKTLINPLVVEQFLEDLVKPPEIKTPSPQVSINVLSSINLPKVKTSLSPKNQTHTISWMVGVVYGGAPPSGMEAIMTASMLL